MKEEKGDGEGEEEKERESERKKTQDPRHSHWNLVMDKASERGNLSGTLYLYRASEREVEEGVKRMRKTSQDVMSQEDFPRCDVPRWEEEDEGEALVGDEEGSSGRPAELGTRQGHR